MFVLFSISVRFYSSIYFIRFSMNIFYPVTFSVIFTIVWCFRSQWTSPSLVADTVGWWAQVDSNHRPRAYQARALTTWAMSPLSYFRCISSLSPYFASLNFIRVWPRRLAAGGDDGIRTHDPLLAGQVLSQLSYTPLWKWRVNSEEWKVKSFGWKASLFFIIHPLWVSLSESLKIEQQQTCTRSKFLSPPLSHISFRFRLSTYDTASCVFRSMLLSP